MALPDSTSVHHCLTMSFDTVLYNPSSWNSIFKQTKNQGKGFFRNGGRLLRICCDSVSITWPLFGPTDNCCFLSFFLLPHHISLIFVPFSTLAFLISFLFPISLCYFLFFIPPSLLLPFFHLFRYGKTVLFGTLGSSQFAVGPISAPPSLYYVPLYPTQRTCYTLKLWTAGSSKTFVLFYQTTRRHLPGDCSNNIHYCGILRAHVIDGLVVPTGCLQ
jgi:hypothetical protein